jgi:hypothetical protein
MCQYFTPYQEGIDSVTSMLSNQQHVALLRIEEEKYTMPTLLRPKQKYKRTK